MTYEKRSLFVTITSRNDDGKMDVKTFDDCENLVHVTRLIHTFKPKRGYKVIHFEIEYVPTLV